MQKFRKLLLLLVAVLALGQVRAQLNLPITFDDSNITYTMTNFDGGTTTLMANPSQTGINTTPSVLRMVKNTGQVWGGSKLMLNSFVDFTTNNTFKMKVYSPRVGCPVLFKLEDATGAAFVQKSTTTTVANQWEELSWDFSGSASGTFNHLVFIYDLGVMGDGSANFTFYQDDIQFVQSTTGPGLLNLPITFEAPGVTYTALDFNGGATTVMSNPLSAGINTSTTVQQMIKNADQVWGGTKMFLASTLDFTTNNTFKMKVLSPRTGCPVLFKLEDATGNIFVEKTTLTSVANQWEELSWSFVGAASGTYNSIVIIYDLGVMGDGSPNFTFYQDDINFVQGGGGGLNQIDLPITFEATNVDYSVTDFGGNFTVLGPDPTNAANTVAITTKGPGSEFWAGTTASTPAGLANVIPFTTTDRTMRVRVYSPDAGIPIRLKAEVHGQQNQSVETDVMTTVANQWEYLTFDFNNHVSGTPAFDPNLPYDLVSIFFNFGTTGAIAGSKTYYWDNLMYSTFSAIESPFTASVKITPNPAQNELFVQLGEIPANQVQGYTLIDMTGSVKMKGELTQNALNISNLASGIYSLQILTETGVITKRFIKE
ncbi:MAG: T9SS type A sorting domain-containing protein [Bacteroidia bacterium]